MTLLEPVPRSAATAKASTASARGKLCVMSGPAVDAGRHELQRVADLVDEAGGAAVADLPRQ